jgi:predicted NAD-dependent protein-ADP-ribosyltransferase YbiA (DUF1768 family)
MPEELARCPEFPRNQERFEEHLASLQINEEDFVYIINHLSSAAFSRSRGTYITYRIRELHILEEAPVVNHEQPVIVEQDVPILITATNNYCVLHNNFLVDEDISVPTFRDDDVKEWFFPSVRWAFEFCKFLAIDHAYATTVINNTRKNLSIIASKQAYVKWKVMTQQAMTTDAVGTLYDTKIAEFEAIQVECMARLLWEKFAVDSSTNQRRFLLATRNAHLHLSDSDEPSFWTVGGADMFGRLLMHIRSHLQRGSQFVEQVLADLDF